MQAGAIAVPRLIAAARALLEAAGLPPEAAQTVAGDLVMADQEGVHSHGVMLLPLYVDRILAGSVSRATEARVVQDLGAIAVLDAGNIAGQLSARQAVDMALAKSRQFGLGAVAVSNAFHLGMAGLYARSMAEAGAVGIVTSNTRPLLPPPGGGEAMTGNNPLAIAVPAEGAFPASVDMALSAVAMGRIRNAASAGQAIPADWATDADGVPTTDPLAAIKGMLLPAAGPKGFGLAFMLDLIAGGLSGGGIGPEVRGLYGDPAVPYGCAAFFLAIDVAAFTDAGDFRNRSRAALDRVSATKPAPGVARVFAPGERSWSRRQANATHATPPAQAMSELSTLGQRLGVDIAALLQDEEQK